LLICYLVVGCCLLF